MRIDILTVFPEMIRPVLEAGVLGKAVAAGKLDVRLHDFRRWTTDKHHKVDDKPYGGGPGMVLKCEPLYACLDDVWPPADRDASGSWMALLTPQGRPFTQRVAEELAKLDRLVLVCGRYEGFDERVRDGLQPDEISIGDYVLTGGEPAAIVVIDAVSRLIPGVLGHEHSSDFESFDAATGLLDYPVYTRPVEFRGMRVPDVLLSGNHEEVARWRMDQARRRTTERRPDLLEGRDETDRADQLANVQRQPRGWRKTGIRPEPDATDE